MTQKRPAPRTVAKPKRGKGIGIQPPRRGGPKPREITGGAELPLRWSIEKLKTKIRRPKKV